MKRWMVYFIVCTYLSTFTEVRQLTKIPNLLEHFISHKLSNSEMTVGAFIKMHYLDEQVKDSDFNQDMKLPFKTHDFSGPTVYLNIPPEKAYLIVEQPAIFVDRSCNFSYSETFYPSPFSKIWEPPKI